MGGGHARLRLQVKSRMGYDVLPLCTFSAEGALGLQLRVVKKEAAAKVKAANGLLRGGNVVRHRSIHPSIKFFCRGHSAPPAFPDGTQKWKCGFTCRPGLANRRLSPPGCSASVSLWTHGNFTSKAATAPTSIQSIASPFRGDPGLSRAHKGHWGPSHILRLAIN